MKFKRKKPEMITEREGASQRRTAVERHKNRQRD
jgi:hypothetical protein